jgi:hypothetical protein
MATTTASPIRVAAGRFLVSVVEDADLGWYVSAPMPVPVPGGAPRRIIVDGYDDG